MRALGGACLFLCFALSARAPAAPAPAKPASADRVVLDTSLGKITLKLYPKQAPASVANFLRYVDEKHYDGTVIHRVIPGFVMQGGGYEPGLVEKKTRAPIKNESANGLSNRRGTIAVARTVDPDSGTAQFYINLKDNPFLDRRQGPASAGYCVFGEVIAGMDVVEQIARVATGRQGVLTDVPIQPVVIRSARRGR